MFSPSLPSETSAPTTKQRRKFVSVTAAIVGCVTLSVVAPSLSSAASAAPAATKAVTRPWFEHGSAEFDSVGNLTNVKATDAHMGKVFDPSLGVVYAPNGDTATYQGGDNLDATSVRCSAAIGVYRNKHADGEISKFRFTALFTGGTGRFAGATGTDVTEGCAVTNPDGSGFYEYEGHGTITY
jgi:hypothetical protein